MKEFVRGPAKLEGEDPPRGPVREFLISVRDFEGYRIGGPGLALEDVLAREVRHFVPAEHDDVRKGYYTADQWAALSQNEVIWEGGKVVAIIRAIPGCDRPEVIRFDPRRPLGQRGGR